MTARRNHRVIKKVFADLAAERGFERREKRERRVEPVGRVGDVECRLHEGTRVKCAAVVQRNYSPAVARGPLRGESEELDFETALLDEGKRWEAPRPAD